MGRGSSKVGTGGTGANTTPTGVRSTPEYRESYDDEMSIQRDDVPVGNAMPYADRDDAAVEAQMRGYASAIGDPIRAMERQRDSVRRQVADYEEGATSNSDLGIRDAMRDILDDYDVAIERMRRIKANSPRADLL